MKIKDCFIGIIKLLFIILSFLLFPNVRAQNDTLLLYNSLTGIAQLLPFVPFDTTIITAHSNGNSGLLPGVMDFAQLNNYCTDTSVLPRCPISEDYSLENYPLRCMVRVIGYSGKYVGVECSGTLVGRNFVLTAGHCIYDYNHYRWFDSIRVYPAYNDTTIPPELNYTTSHHYYVLDSSYETLPREDETNDIALIQLDNDIGTTAGWLSIGFSNDTLNTYKNSFYCTGYPGGRDRFHPNLDYNDDYLYFQRIGIYIDSNYYYYDKKMLFYTPPITSGFSGSAALGLFSDSLICFGDAVTAEVFARITPSRYYAFMSIINAQDSIPDTTANRSFNFNTFPNPTNGSFYLNCTVPENTTVTATMYNPLGQNMGSWQFSVLQGYSTHLIDAGPLPEGVYLLQVIGTTGLLNTTRVLISGK